MLPHRIVSFLSTSFGFFSQNINFPHIAALSRLGSGNNLEQDQILENQLETLLSVIEPITTVDFTTQNGQQVEPLSSLVEDSQLKVNSENYNRTIDILSLSPHTFGNFIAVPKPKHFDDILEE